jgi:SAM-dependent methyltransferase
MSSGEWDRRYAGTELVWSAEPNRFVAEALAELPPGRALDLGAGEGRNAIWLAGLGWRVTAVDFSAVALEKARALAAANQVKVEWVRADVLTYPAEPGGFDLVVLAYLQLPPEERATVLRIAATALAPGGALFLVAHDLTNLTDGVGGPQFPEVLYTPDEVIAALPGFEIRRAERARRVVPGHEPAEAIDTLVLAIRPR